jgi:hypothetical protein
MTFMQSKLWMHIQYLTKAKWLLGLLLIMASASCTKDPLGCIKSTGEIKTERYPAESFQAVLAMDNIDITFHYVANPEDVGVEISAGKNLLPKIKIENQKFVLRIPGDSLNTGSIDSLDRLVITNENQCNWVRSFETPITAKVFYHKLNHLEYRSVGNINFNDTLWADTFRLDVYEGSGRIDLLLNTKTSYISFHYGSAEIFAQGQSGVSYIYQASYGPIRADELFSQFVYMNNRSTNDTYVHANVHLGVTISYSGNVYYKGDPNINLSPFGTGQLIKME